MGVGNGSQRARTKTISILLWRSNPGIPGRFSPSDATNSLKPLQSSLSGGLSVPAFDSVEATSATIVGLARHGATTPSSAVRLSASGVSFRWSGDPTSASRQHEFWTALRDCLEKLPDSLRDVFLLRELDGVEGEDVCDVLGISSASLWQRLYRARLGLRQCLPGSVHPRSPSRWRYEAARETTVHALRGNIRSSVGVIGSRPVSHGALRRSACIRFTATPAGGTAPRFC